MPRGLPRIATRPSKRSTTRILPRNMSRGLVQEYGADGFKAHNSQCDDDSDNECKIESSEYSSKWRALKGH